jgi:glycosyltransferase involved in cell wall biosynthesis
MPLRVCHISTFSPTQCGIATYVEELIRHQREVSPLRVRMIYPGDRLQSEDLCQIRIPLHEIREYSRATAEINEYRVDVVSLQHEFGIFGGSDGDNVLELTDKLEPPVVTTLHTVYARMSAGKERVLRALATHSKHLVVLTEESRKVLVLSFGVPETKITVIHHGIPSIRFSRPEETALRRTLGTGTVFVSAGHIKPKKGHDVALRALAKFRQNHPTFKYLIVGSSQPQFDRENCHEALLLGLIAREGLGDNVIRINKYLDRKEFVASIQAADIGLVTYTMAGQNSSGILPLILGCGRPVVATDFEYARSVASHVAGVRLANAEDPDAVYEAICELAGNLEHTRGLMLSAYYSTRQWKWCFAADRYMRTYYAVVGMSPR